MWINAIQTGSKTLSPIELLVLSVIPPDDFSANQIAEALKQATVKWEPAAGTLYPILNRLAAAGLLQKSRGKHILFSRTDKASLLLGRNLKALESQIRETSSYYLAIIRSILNIDPVPMGIHEFMDAIVGIGEEYSNELRELKEESKNLKDDSYSVPIEFE